MASDDKRPPDKPPVPTAMQKPSAPPVPAAMQKPPAPPAAPPVPAALQKPADQGGYTRVSRAVYTP